MIRVNLPIETKRFVIRPMREEDTADLFEVYRDADALRHLHLEVPTSVEEATAWVRAKMERHEREGLSLWSVVERRTGAVVGDGGLQRERDESDDVGLDLGSTTLRLTATPCLTRRARRRFDGGRPRPFVPGGHVLGMTTCPFGPTLRDMPASMTCQVAQGNGTDSAARADSGDVRVRVI